MLFSCSMCIVCGGGPSEQRKGLCVSLGLSHVRRTIQMDQPWRQKAPMMVAGILLLGIAVLLFSQLGSPSGPSEAMPVPDAPPAADTKGDMEVAAGHDLSVMSMSMWFTRLLPWNC